MTSRASNIITRISPGTTPKPRFLDKLAKRLLLNRLKNIRHGEITLVDDDTQSHFGQKTEHCPHHVMINVASPDFYSDICFGGSIGAGEAYMAGSWQVDDLTKLVQILCCNRDVLDGLEGGLASLTLPIQKSLHWLNRNTQSGSRRNIAAHYDLGNDFFALMLDKSLMYSCAIFAHPQQSLYEAQIHRMNHLCRQLELQPGEHLLEIGTGWGSLAMHAAAIYGVNVTTTTISQQQYDLAVARVKANGLEKQVTVLLEDYRNLEGQYDKLISIEMIEAVGHQFYSTYFKKCGELVKPNGLMLLQAITIADQHYETARKSVDFIQRYIFPGSCIPSVTSLINNITGHTDMCLYNLEDIGLHYATTLQHWRQNVANNIHAVRKLGYSEEFLRMWEFYLCYCEGGFRERAISDVLMLLAKPEYKPEARDEDANSDYFHPGGQQRRSVYY